MLLINLFTVSWIGFQTTLINKISLDLTLTVHVEENLCQNKLLFMFMFYWAEKIQFETLLRENFKKTAK